MKSNSDLSKLANLRLWFDNLRKMLNIRHLAVFHAVIRTGSVSGAARLLHVSQPAVSKSVRRLEEQIGLPLFQRISGRLHRTPESETLMPQIERLFGHVEAVDQLAKEIRDGFSGSVTVAAVSTLSASLVATAIARFHRQYPRVRFDIKALSTRHAIDYVLNNQVDLAVLDVPLEGADLQVSELCRAPIGCVVPAKHPLARLKEVTPEMLARHLLITFGEDTMTGSSIREAFRKRGKTCQIAFTVNQTLSAYALVKAGAGVALMDPFPFLSGAFADLVMVPFRPVIEMRPRVVYAKTRPVSQIARKFTAELTAVTANLIGARKPLLRAASAL